MYSSKIWLLEKFDFWKILTQEDIAYLDLTLTKRNVRKNEQISFDHVESAPIYFLKRGIMKIVSYQEDGEETIKSILKEGAIFGELSLSVRENPNDYAIALKDAIICYLSKDEFNHILMKNSALYNEVVKVMGSRIEKLERKIDALLFKDSRTRIVEFLEDLKREYGYMENNTIVVKNFLTHYDIAKLTSTSRQFVTKTLSELKKSGTLDYDKKNLVFASNRSAKYLFGNRLNT